MKNSKSARSRAIDPVDILRNLIRFETVNPPGNEGPCIAYVNRLVRDAGLETAVLEDTPNRPNLIARLKGRGDAPPFMMYGHVDVVTVAGQQWIHPPFGGVVADGCVWGRGALDMKGGVAMMISAFLRAHRQGLRPAGDIILAVLSDEEAGGDCGAKFLVRDHASLFDGVQCAIGEFGGFSVRLAGRKYYMIQVDEKRVCWMRALIRGPGGHGSQPMQGGAMAKLGRMLVDLDEHLLPVHITPQVRAMVEKIAETLPGSASALIRRLLDPAQTDEVLRTLGDAYRFLLPLVRNTVNAVQVQGGEKSNVIPSLITLDLDGRLLPGYTADDLIAEVREIVGDAAEYEIKRHDDGPGEADMGLVDTLEATLREADPDAIAVPYLLGGATDGRHFAKLGVRSYGFIPMNLPPDFSFIGLVHGENERIPIECLEFGTQTLYRLLERYGERRF